MGLIGSAIGAVGSIFGGIKASKAMKKAKRNVEAQRQKNQDWYDRRYNEDATQRADAQRILRITTRNTPMLANIKFISIVLFLSF